MSEAQQRLKVLKANTKWALSEKKEDQGYETMRAFRDHLAKAEACSFEKSVDDELCFVTSGVRIKMGYSGGKLWMRPIDPVLKDRDAYPIPLQFDGDSWVSTVIDDEIVPEPGRPYPVKTPIDVLTDIFCTIYTDVAPRSP
jgi:hypothetical protein